MRVSSCQCPVFPPQANATSGSTRKEEALAHVHLNLASDLPLHSPTPRTDGRESKSSKKIKQVQRPSRCLFPLLQTPHPKPFRQAAATRTTHTSATKPCDCGGEDARMREEALPPVWVSEVRPPGFRPLMPPS